MAKFKCNVEGKNSFLHIVPRLFTNNTYFEIKGLNAHTGVQLDDAEVRRLIRKLQKWLLKTKSD